MKTVRRCKRDFYMVDTGERMFMANKLYEQIPLVKKPYDPHPNSAMFINEKAIEHVITEPLLSEYFDTPMEVAASPTEFCEKMKTLHSDFSYDEEEFHAEADALMCELLRSLGYGDGVDVFERSERRYA